MIWVYAIGDRPEAPPRGTGLGDAPLEGVREGALVAVVSRHDAAPGAVEDLWAHERVVEAAMEDRAVLPARFGTTLEDDAALRAVLAERQDEFLAALARVRGRLEVGIRAVQPAEAPRAPAATGREYLEGRLRDDRSAQALHETLTGLAVEAARRPSRPGEVLRAAYLIEAPALAGFRATVDRLQREHADMAILCTGPWPPYSFARGSP